jgi:hypothetical protein
MFLLGFLWIISLVGKLSSQSNKCDYYQALKPSVIYTISSTRYPQNYVRGTDCRWAAEAPPGYKVSLTCNEVKLPATFFCNGDRILVSLVGRADLRDGRKHCGGVAFMETSSSTRMTIALKTGQLTRGGRFKCALKAVANSCSCGQLNSGRIGESHEMFYVVKFLMMTLQLEELNRK